MRKTKTELRVYAGIGSRRTPEPILARMEQIGREFARLGWILRTGNCTGADQAFQRGANAVDPSLVELYLPWPGYEAAAVKPGNVVHLPIGQAYAIARRFHPAWHNCSQSVRSLHARNAQIILGAELASPAGLVVCWTPGGRETGGTGLGIRLARAYGLPVCNLADEKAEQALRRFGISAGHVAAKDEQMCFDFLKPGLAAWFCQERCCMVD